MGMNNNRQEFLDKSQIKPYTEAERAMQDFILQCLVVGAAEDTSQVIDIKKKDYEIA